MHELIKSLSLTLSVPGLSPRVCILFNQAMGTTQFQWGTKARMVAGACLSIALRESGRPDSLKDIAYLLERSDLSLKRTLSSILAALNLTLTPTGPTQFLPTLQSHLHSILQLPVESSGLNISLYSELKPLSIQSATETSRLFIDILARFSPETSLLQLSSAAVACAVFILSLEAEKRGSFSNLADISTLFANRCQVAKTTVMNRYKSIQDEVAKWTEEVEWLDSHQKSSNRAKIARRLLCARGLKDALSWKSSLWKKRVEAENKRNLEPLPNSSHSDPESGSSSSRLQGATSTIAKSESMQPSRKKRKVAHSAVVDAAQFLLDPVNGPLSRRSSKFMTASSAKASPDAFTMSCYVLSDTSSLSNGCSMPSRLQQLSATRGGSDVILDDELLAEGEWESIERNPEEVKSLERRWRDEGIFDHLEKASSVASKKHESRKRVGGCGVTENLTSGTRPPGSKRINLEALSQFMLAGDAPNHMFDLDMLGLEILEDKDEKDEEEHEEENTYDASDVYVGAEEGLMIDDWRPCSPGLDEPFDDYYL